MVIRGRVWRTSMGKRKKPMCERGPVCACVMILYVGILSGTCVWLGLCHPRVLMCERGGMSGPFRVADKAGSGDL